MKNTKRNGHISYLIIPDSPVSRHVPFIRLSGKWIEDAGLNIGDAIEINICKSGLTISKSKTIQAI